MDEEKKSLSRTRRDYLKRIPIDMEEVYWELDNGKSLNEVALSLGVTTRTLYRHHKRYQEEMEE